jgi:hypothetical protein
MMPFPVSIQAGTTVTAFLLDQVSVPVIPPILGPCGILARGDRLGVYDSDSGELVTTYVFTGGVLEPDFQKG